MKKMLLAIVALLACHTMQAQYFCTTQGTELHYVNYDEAGQSLSNETVTVYNVVKNASGESAQYLAKIVTNKTKNNTSYTLYNWNYDGNVTTCQEDLMYGPYIKYDSKARQAMAEELKLKGDNSFTIKKHASAGESIPDRTYSLIFNMLKNEINISGAAYMGEEKVSTTAGKFDCIKISYLKRTKIVLKTETVRVTEWYAEGIGLVKSESYNTKGEPDGKTILVKIVK